LNLFILFITISDIFIIKQILHKYIKCDVFTGKNVTNIF